MPPLPNQRHLFDMPDGVSWFNCASRTPFLKATAEAGLAGINDRLHPWAWDAAATAARLERLRGLFAGLIGATAGDIAVQPSASYGLATAAANLPLAAGQDVLVLEDQFPSNVFIWQEKAAQAGARLVTVPRPADHDWTAAVLDRVGPRTAIAALPPCHWADGGRVDLAAIGARCREVGAALVADVTQSAGAQPFDVAAVRPDFLVSAAYKWLLCPIGMSFLYAAPHRQDGRPLEHHDYNHPVTGGSIEGRLVYDMAYSEGARRFDVGQTHNLTLLPMAEAALDQVARWTPAAVGETLAPVTARIADAAAEMGYQVVPERHRSGHFTAIRKGTLPPAGMIGRLAGRGIYASLRCGGLRLAPHVYVADADVGRLLAALKGAWP